MGGMVLFTASSVSLEGRTIWILRSLPVGTRDILRAKLRLSFRLTGPCVLLFSLAALWLVKPDPVSAAGLLAAPLLFTALAGNLGLMENLRHVNLDWINEAQPVKQGAAVIYTMLLLWAVVHRFRAWLVSVVWRSPSPPARSSRSTAPCCWPCSCSRTAGWTRPASGCSRNWDRKKVRRDPKSRVLTFPRGKLKTRKNEIAP
jgi:hypothetical protein